MTIHKRMHHMLWFDSTASPADLHSLVLRRNTVLSVPVGGHRCTVNLPSQKKNGNVYFQIQRMPQIHWTAKRKSLEAENVLAGPLKTPHIRVITQTSVPCLLVPCSCFWWWIRSPPRLLWFQTLMTHCTVKDEIIHIYLKCSCTKSSLVCRASYKWQINF